MKSGKHHSVKKLTVTIDRVIEKHGHKFTKEERMYLREAQKKLKDCASSDQSGWSKEDVQLTASLIQAIVQIIKFFGPFEL